MKVLRKEDDGFGHALVAGTGSNPIHAGRDFLAVLIPTIPGDRSSSTGDKFIEKGDNWTAAQVIDGTVDESVFRR